MRIDAYNQISQIYKTGSKTKPSKVQKTSGKDKVEISSFGKAFQVAKQAVNNASDVREDKVADIKARMAAGTYNVSNESFADKLLEKFDSAI